MIAPCAVMFVGMVPWPGLVPAPGASNLMMVVFFSRAETPNDSAIRTARNREYFTNRIMIFPPPFRDVFYPEAVNRYWSKARNQYLPNRGRTFIRDFPRCFGFCRAALEPIG